MILGRITKPLTNPSGTHHHFGWIRGGNIWSIRRCGLELLDSIHVQDKKLELSVAFDHPKVVNKERRRACEKPFMELPSTWN
jgi:hypothetical protein